MTLPIGRPRSADRRAFTLIEFILVMALLLVVFGVSIPTLANFFRGRNLDGEARRFVSLTRFGQSRAVSEGIPIILWMDTKAGVCALEEEQGYNLLEEAKETRIELDEKLEMETGRALTASSQNRPILATTRSGQRNLPMIRFQPDGSVAEGSPENIWIREIQERQTTNEIWIVLTTNRLRYEIQTNVQQNAWR